MPRNRIFLRLFFLIILVFTQPVSANAGVPVIFISFPLVLAGLIPVILIEIFFYWRVLKIEFRPLVSSTSLANLLSTLVGYPLAWGLLLGLEILTTGGSCGPGFDNALNGTLTAILEAAWLCDHATQLFWLIPVAFLLNLIIAYFISVFAEYLLIKRVTGFSDKKQLKRAVWQANLISYVFLLGTGLIYLFKVRNS